MNENPHVESSGNLMTDGCSCELNESHCSNRARTAEEHESVHKTDLSRCDSYSSGYASCDYITTYESEIDSLLQSRDTSDGGSDVSCVLSAEQLSSLQLPSYDIEDLYEVIHQIENPRKATSDRTGSSEKFPEKECTKKNNSANRTVPSLQTLICKNEMNKEDEPVYLSIDDILAEPIQDDSLVEYDLQNMSLIPKFESQMQSNIGHITQHSVLQSNDYFDSLNIQNTCQPPKFYCIETDHCEICSPHTIQNISPARQLKKHNTINGYYRVDQDNFETNKLATPLCYHIPSNINSNIGSYLKSSCNPPKKVRFEEDVQQITYDQHRSYNSNKFKISFRRLRGSLPASARSRTGDDLLQDSMFKRKVNTIKPESSIRTDLQLVL